MRPSSGSARGPDPFLTHALARGLYRLFAELGAESATQDRWVRELERLGEPVPSSSPGLRVRLAAWLVGCLGPRRMLPVLSAMKVRGLAIYRGGDGESAGDAATPVVAEESWHRAARALEREEMREMPEEEVGELALIYRTKGLDAAQAEALAGRIVSDPERGLATLAREELVSTPEASPRRPWRPSPRS